MARYMLDTNVLVQWRQRRPETVPPRVTSLDPGDAVMSVVTYGELRNGAEKSDHRERLLMMLAEMARIVAVDDLPVAAGIEYGELRSFLERKGETIGANDLWIAAHARARDLILVTSNEREFRRVPGLSVENWAAA